MKTVIVTGSAGFIGSFLCQELLGRGYRVVGYDNYSKYGYVKRPFDTHPNFHFVKKDLASGLPGFHNWSPDYIIAGAAMIGGISYFHKYAYDLLATNERITANTFDAAIEAKKQPSSNLNRIVVLSSSMVFEGADAEFSKLNELASLNCCGPGNFCVDPEKQVWPSKETHITELPPPRSTYGFQKLSTEYFAKGAYEQYGLPYTIVRPFNCVGVGEGEAKGEASVMSGNVKLMMSHVLPDLINKCLLGQDPLHILGDGSQVRCYTHGKDIARGIVEAMERSSGLMQDFNISTPVATTVMELAKLVWEEINPTKEFNYVSDTPFEYDVQRRVPDVSKARDILGFEALIPLKQSIKEVIEYIRELNKEI